MSYRFIITDGGNRTFSREVSAEQALELMFRLEHQGGVAGPKLEAPMPETETIRAPRKRLVAPKPVKHSGRFTGHECCGSKGSKHLLTCKMNRKAGTSTNARLVADRKTAFSNATWSSVKNALDSGDTVDMVVRSKGLDEDEVRRVNLSDTYEEYLTIA